MDSCNAFDLLDFFTLQEHPKGVEALDLSKNGAMAVLGDALLGFLVVEQLSMDSNKTKGEISMERQQFECAEAQALFLKTATDLLERYPSMETRNDHTISTVFEALVCSSYHLNGIDCCRKCVALYIQWIRDSGVTLPVSMRFRALLDLRGHILVESFEDLPFEIDVPPWGNGLLVQMRTQRLDVADERGFAVAKQMESWEGIAKGREDGEHLAKELVAVNWTSRQRYAYQDYYFPCCGQYCKTEPSKKPAHIPRCTWWDLSSNQRNAIHLGEMQDIGGGKNGGGGKPQWKENHHPRGKAPHWSCCGQPVGCVGCHPPLDTLSLPITK